MRNNLLIWIISFALITMTSCKSWDKAAAMKVDKVPFNPKILTCQVKIHGEEIENKPFGIEERRLFLAEVEENISDPFGDKFGYIELFRIHEEAKLGMMPWILINGPLFQLPLLFGVPMSKPEIKIAYEVRIYDSNRKLLGKYEGNGEARNKIAAYHGYHGRDAFTKTYVESAKQAFSEIREKIRNDALTINSSLMKAGKIKN